MSDEPTLWVRRQWNASLAAEIRLADLSGLHWSDFSGGVGKRANRPYLHGYMSCDAIISGDLDHSCMHGPPPHRIKVCVVAKDNDRKLMATLKAGVAPRKNHLIPGGA